MTQSLSLSGTQTKKSKIKLIKQEHVNGCLIAVIAMMAGKTYDQIFQKLYNKPASSVDNWDMRGINFKHYEKVIAKFGIELNETKAQVFRDLHKPTFAVIHWRGSSMAHGIIYDPYNKLILDPGRYDQLENWEYEYQVHKLYHFNKGNNERL